MTYQEQLKHPKWQKKRLEVLQHNKFICQECGEAEEELHVHHTQYKKGAAVWEYDVSELQCLCHSCHQDTHDLEAAIKERSNRLLPAGKQKVLSFIDSLPNYKRRKKTIMNRKNKHVQKNVTADETKSAADDFFARMRAMLSGNE